LLTRPTIRTLIAVLALACAPGVAAAADCSGGSIGRLGVRADRVRFDGTVTLRGATHASLVAAPPGLHLTLFRADDGSFRHEITVPPERFVTHGGVTRYDGTGSFHGRIVLRNARRQADTVRIRLTELDADASAIIGATPAARAGIDSGDGCARTCVSACRVSGGRLACEPSRPYAPFPEQGFGAFDGARPARASSYCGLVVAPADPCDYLIDERCILPYPSSYFLQPDGSTPTGLRLAYPATALPATFQNVHIDPTDWNTLDGYSPGPMILSLFPDTGFPVDLMASNVAPQTDFARSLDADHPTVLVEAASAERVLHFAEMDANTSDVGKKALIIRPGKRLKDGTRYVVGIRSLVDTHGTPILPRLAFRAVRDMSPALQTELGEACGSGCAAALAARATAFQGVFGPLAQAGVSRGDLLLAWDFTTASTDALTGWIRAVRDQAFALGTPSFTVTGVDDGGGAGRNANIWAEIQGTFQAPLFMTADAPGSRLNLVAGVPAQNGYATVPFVVEVPRSAWNGSGSPAPGRPSLWGHGLLGDRFQVRGLSPLANTYDFVMAAVDMQGMSSSDLGSVLTLIQNLSFFHFIPERLHQGFLNHLLLGRLLVDPVNGFNSHPAFQFGGTPIIDTTEVYYSGGSQGGIFGIAIMSIAEDFKRGFLAVPGANYSTLLHRSVDFSPFLAALRSVYSDRLDEEIGVALIQQLWDRAEPQGYMSHLVSGDLSTPPVPHKILIHMSKCDSQVSNLGTEIMVRSLGIAQVSPPLQSFFQVPEMAAPYDGSASVEIDWQKCGSRCNVPGGDSPGAACTTDADCPGLGDPPTRTRCDSGTPPLSNTPPAFENGAHGAEGGASPLAPEAQQVDAFLRPAGDVEQFCVGPCDPN